MRSGNLRHRVTIQAPTRGQSVTNAPTETWVDVATVWAAVEPIKGREYFAAQAVQADVTTRVRLRYRAGLSTGMRLVYGDKTLDILAVIDPGERRRELELMCREVF